MKRFLIGMGASALVTLFVLWLITRGFGELMDGLGGLAQPGKGGSMQAMVIVGAAVFLPLLVYRIRKARKNRQRNDRAR